MARFFLLLIICLALAGPAAARLRAPQAADPAQICEIAAMRAAAEYGVPPDIMIALTLTETGRRLDGRTRPWAWSVNAAGKGSWFGDAAEALAFAEDEVARGQNNVDIGCFQVNYRWHGENFTGVAAMFDPMTNARYAADFVRRLYAETGDWRRAAGAFHSRRPANSARYLAQFDQLRARHGPMRGRGAWTVRPKPITTLTSAP